MSKTEKLVSKAKSGNQNAFTKLYELTKNEVWFTCLSLAKNEENAKDIMQDTYITAFLKINSIDDNGKFSSWIKRIAVNKSKDFLKSRVDCQLNEEVIMDLIETDEIVLPEEYITKDEKRKTILQLMEDTLSSAQYQTVFMHYFDNMTVSEIAEVFDCPEGTVMSRLSLARTKMKKAVTDYEAKNNDKLHSVAVLPLFSEVFKAQSKSLKAPKMIFSFPAEAGQGIVATVTDTAVKSTFGGISKAVMTKVAVALCSLIVVGGAVTTAIVWAQSGKNPPLAIKAVENLDTEKVQEIIEAEDLRVDEDGELTDKDGNKVEITEDGKVELKTEDSTEPENTKANENSNSSAKTEKTENKNQNVKATEAAKPSNTNTNKGTGSGSTQKATQPATQKATEAPKATQPKATQPATQKPTQAPTPKPTEAPKATQPATQKPTQKPTEAPKPTQAPTQPPTEYKAKVICNDCGVDMADWSNAERVKHMGNHARNGGYGSYHVE